MPRDVSWKSLAVASTLLVALASGCAGDTGKEKPWGVQAGGEADAGVSEGRPDVETPDCVTDVTREMMCDGVDDDCDGRVDEGLARKCALQKGVCAGAVVFCRGGRFPKCSDSRYGADYLEREGSDACDGLDNDCDGEIDEKCRCTPGQQRGCYSGSPQTRGVGQCQAGTQRCESDGTWGACEREVLPDDEETCGGGDDDCDGVVDEGCTRCAYKGRQNGVCTGQRRPANGSCPEPDAYESQTAAERHCDQRDNDCDGRVDEGCYEPVAPTTMMFGWQSTRPRLEHEETGRVCRSRIAIQVTGGAMCYVERGTNQLKCAGEVGGKDFGETFSGYGRRDVDQILISRDSSEMCTLADHRVECFGQNDHGLFGTGDTRSVSSGSPAVWGERSDVAAIGTGAWNNLCAVTTDDEIYCAGEQFGTSVSRVGTGSTFWLDRSGSLHVEPTDVVGVSDNASTCRLARTGGDRVQLRCGAQVRSYTYGSNVVGGGRTKPLPSEHFYSKDAVCTLEQNGSVLCSGHPYVQDPRRQPMFENIDVAALAVSENSSTRCAVGKDGSIWCIGDNTNGKLGTGDADDLTSETRVQPPGSVRFGCF